MKKIIAFAMLLGSSVANAELELVFIQGAVTNGYYVNDILDPDPVEFENWCTLDEPYAAGYVGSYYAPSYARGDIYCDDGWRFTKAQGRAMNIDGDIGESSVFSTSDGWDRITNGGTATVTFDNYLDVPQMQSGEYFWIDHHSFVYGKPSSQLTRWYQLAYDSEDDEHYIRFREWRNVNSAQNPPTIDVRLRVGQTHGILSDATTKNVVADNRHVHMGCRSRYKKRAIMDLSVAWAEIAE